MILSSATNFTRGKHWLRRNLMVLIALMLFAGCGTTTTRIATEQLLMSDAVDQAISQIDFQSLRGERVYLDTQYLHSVKGVGFVNAEYIISSLRQQLTAARCLIQDSREAADIVVEPRVGALGTDGHEVVYGIPQSGSLTSAAAILSSAPIPAIPELSVGKSNAQSGIAKVIVFAYDRQTRKPVWQSGIAKAESTSSNTWYLGAGPFQKGSIYEGMRFAGHKIPPPPQFENLAHERGHLEDLRPGHEGEDIEITRSFVFEPVEYGQAYEFQRSIPRATAPDEELSKSDDSKQDPDVKRASHKEPVKK